MLFLFLLTGFITGKLLCILDKLDRYNFDRAKTSPAINQIYEEIILIWNEKTNNEVWSNVHIFCKFLAISRTTKEEKFFANLSKTSTIVMCQFIG